MGVGLHSKYSIKSVTFMFDLFNTSSKSCKLKYFNISRVFERDYLALEVLDKTVWVIKNEE